MPEEKKSLLALEVDDRELKLCRLCGSDLVGGARRIGVCAWCVAADKYSAINLPSPKYGTNSDG